MYPKAPHTVLPVVGSINVDPPIPGIITIGFAPFKSRDKIWFISSVFGVFAVFTAHDDANKANPIATIFFAFML